MVVIPDSLDQLSAQEVRELFTGLMTKVAQQDQELVYRQTKIDQLTHEMAVLKRNQFGRSREQLDSTQVSLLGEAFDDVTRSLKMTQWGCGVKLGLPGGSSCIHTKSEFVQ